MKGVIGTEQLAQAASGVVGLLPAVLCELYSVVGDGLVDFAVLLKDRVSRENEQMADEQRGILLPSDWACRMRMMSLGLAMMSVVNCNWRQETATVKARTVMEWEPAASYCSGSIQGRAQQTQRWQSVALRALLTGKCLVRGMRRGKATGRNS